MSQTVQSLIVSTGQLDNDRSWFGLRKSAPNLPDVAYGQKLVLLNSKGEAVPAEVVTGGERTFGQFRSWVLVDVRTQELVFEYDNLWSTSYASYLITVHLQASVADAKQLVASGTSSLDTFCRPKVAAAVKQALRDTVFPDGKIADPVNQMRALAENSLHAKMVAKLLPDLPDWLDLSVTDISVRNDADAEKHVKGLRGHLNSKDVIIASGLNDLTRTKLDLRKRELVRNALSAHMSDSSVALLEAIWDNPTTKNIAAASDRMREKELGEQANFRALLAVIQNTDTVLDADGMLRAVRQLLETERNEVPVIEVTSERENGERLQDSPGQPVSADPHASPGSAETVDAQPVEHTIDNAERLKDPPSSETVAAGDPVEERRAKRDLDDANFTNG
ncbi:hypothetical protein [Kribbella lupini]|uniref:SPFH domain/Band 7 family protein n=1 Tax=Kribbella lupini TaxID=291602 RepID=A0ABP4L5Y8_9ACTN